MYRYSTKTSNVPASAKVRLKSNWQSKRPMRSVDSEVYGLVVLHLFNRITYMYVREFGNEYLNADTGKPTCWFGVKSPNIRGGDILFLENNNNKEYCVYTNE